jgi:plasmid stabilization system protein ParE
MSDNNKFEQLIELFIAEDEQGAKDLFHEIVVEKSRDIYESLVDEEQVEETAEVEEDAEAVEESGFDEAEIGGDQSDDMIDDIEADEQGLSMEADADDEEIEDRVVDIENALEELKAEFDALMGGDDAEGGDEEMDMDMDMDSGDEEGDEEEEEMESVEPVEEETEEMVREYTEKAPAPVTAEQGDGSTGPVAGKNDMGGSAKNLAQGGEEKGGATPKSTVQTDAANPKGATMSKA